MIAERTKRCCHCKMTKPLVEFRRNRSTADGLQFCCKACQSKQQKNYLRTPKGRERQRTAQKNYLKTESGKVAQKQSNKNWIKKMRAVGYYRFGKGKIQNLKSAAKRRGLQVAISGEELKLWWETTPHICAYCGQSPNEYRKTASSLTSYEGEIRLLRLLKGKLNRLKQALAYDLTIDRADNQRGYELANLMKACWICNLVKGHFLTSAEMNVVARRIRKEIEIGLNETN